MSDLRGRLVWFLCCITLAAGLMSAAGGTAHAQSASSFLLSGTVVDGDGAPVQGLSVGVAGYGSFVTRADGSFNILLIRPGAAFIVSVGDTLNISVRDGEQVVTTFGYTITEEDIASSPPGATVSIGLSGLEAVLTPSSLPADGMSTTVITVNNVADGQPVTGDTVTITAEQGTVGDVTDNDDGTYTATYTAPELVLSEDATDTITIDSASTGETTTVDVTVTPVPTLLSVSANPAIFTAGSGETGTISVNVSRGGDAVADAEIGISADAGTVGDVTNHGNGTYSATYTPSAMVGRGIVTATDAVSGVSGSAAVTVNAGAPATLGVTVAPTTVSSNGNGLVTAVVADSSGNPVGGLTAEGTANAGTVGAFAESDELGTYTASYTAPAVEEDGSDIVTVTVGDLTGVATVDLTPEPPMSVSVLIVTGDVNKADGTGTVPGVAVEVTVNGQMAATTSDENGSYSVTFVDPNGAAGSTGDIVSVVVSDEDGVVVGTANKVLTNADLGDGDSAVVKVDVDTSVLSTTQTLVVTGTVYHEGGVLPAGAGIAVTATNNANAMSVSGMTAEDGTYSVTFLDPNADVAKTGDMLTVSVMADGAEIGSAGHTLSSAEVDAGSAMVDVNTNMVASAPTLVVTGTVFLLDSDAPAGPGLTVMVSNPDTSMNESGVTDANGVYSVTLFSTGDPVAETGDTLSVTASVDGEEVGSASHTLIEEEIANQQAMVDVNTSIPAESSVFNVTGAVLLEDNMSPAPAGLTVTITNRNQPEVGAYTTTTEEGGTYSVTMLSAAMAVAATHDVLVLDVTVMADDEVVGTTSHTLTTDEVLGRRISDVNIRTTLTADPSNQFVVLGTVTNPDGTNARAGVELRVKLGSDRMETVMTGAGGGYSHTFFDISMPVVSVYDTVSIVAIDRQSGGAANESMEIASHHVLAGRITFDIALIADVIDPVAVAKRSQKFIQKTETVDFDGSESSDYITENVPGVIDSYLWEFGDGNTAATMNTSHQYADSGKYVVTLTVTDIAGNKGMASLEIFVDTVRLGGLSLNTLHGRDVIDKIVSLAIAGTDVGQTIGAEAFLQQMRSDPAMQAAVMEALNGLLPPGMLPGQLLDAELPLIFEDYENIDLENFGNALTARPGSGMGILDSKDGGFTRIVTGNKLDLYLATPREEVGGVTFRVDSPDFDPLTEKGTRDAREAVAGMIHSHTFQLEEEQAALLLPSWPGLGESGIFSSVTLRYASDALPPQYANLLSRGRQVPADPAAYASAPLSQMMINGEVVWSGEVGIETGKIYYYYYEVTLNTPVPLVMGEGDAMMLSSYAIPDPRNLQLEDRGLVDALFTPGVQDAVGALLNPYINAIVAGQDASTIDITEVLSGEALLNLVGSLFEAAIPLYMDIMTTMNPQMVSVFTVPMSTEDQSVWYTTIDLSDLMDGEHFIDAHAFDLNGVQIDNRPVYGKKFVLDRSAPAIDISVDNGQNSAMYTRDDGVIIATGLITPDPNQMASLMLNASSMDSTDDLSKFWFQIIRHDGDPASQMAHTWMPLLDPSIAPMLGGLSAETFDVFIASAFNDMLSINAAAGMPPGMLRSQELIIRGMNNDPAIIAGEYGLRAVGRDNVGNLSSFTMPVRVDIVPPDPDQAVITNIVIGDCNKDGDLEDPFESQAPGESTIFANTGNLTLTIDIPNRTPHPLTGIVVQYKTMHGTASWMDIATIDAVGDVEWNIDDFAALIDGGADDSHIYVRAVATNALTITDPDPAAPTVKLDAGVCPVEPEHIAVNVVAAGTNEETGGYCGIITVSGYTAARTIPDLASVRFDLTMPDGSTMTIGEAIESEVLSEVLTADLTVILGNLVDTVVDGIPTAAQEVGYRKWSITFNTAPLLDSLDAPYVVSATMIGADGMEYAPIAGGTDDFLLHNGDVEVGTTITAVADAYGELPMTEGGFFQLGGFTAEGYDTPVAILTADPAAPDWRVAGVKLLVHMRKDDGSKGDAVDVGEVTVEETVSVDIMTKTSSDKIYTITIHDLSVLGVGGDYVLQVLAYDSKAEPDVEAEDPAFGTAANVDNFTPPPMFTIDGRGEGMSLADFMAAHPLGYRIAQSDNNMFPFSMNAPGVLMGDITVQIDDGTLATDLATIDGMRHDFSIVASTSTTDEGDHPASITVTKRNGSASFDLVNLAIDRIAPMITVLSPTEDDEVSALPTIHAIYNDGEGYGIAVASDDPLDVPANVEIQITRLNPPDESGVPVDQNQLDDADDEVVYSPDDALTGGAYRTDVSVTDKWGNRSTASGEFTVAGTAPSVTILSPMADSVSDDGMPLISAVVTGSGALEVVTMIDGDPVDAAIDGKNLSYTPDPALDEGAHTVTITVTDPDGKMADASVTFNVEFDHSPPVVTEASPQGVVWGPDVTLSVTAVDDQSGVASIAIALDGGEAVDGATRAVEGLTLGQHMATATVTNGDGYSQDYSWTFTISLDEEPPTIGSTSPHGVVRSTTPTVTAGATDLTGIASIAIAVMNSNGDAVEGETATAEDGTSASFMPAGELANGEYSVTAVVADNSGNSASTSWSFTVEASYDTTMPSIDVVSPQGIVRVEMPSVSASASDVSDTAQEGLSGVANIEISVAASDGSPVDGSSEFDGSGSAVFTPGGALANGEYMATATVSDNSGNTNTASWTFTVEVIRDEIAPAIGSTSPQGISRSAMPEISVAAADELSGIGSIEISVMNSAGGAVDGSTAMGEGSAMFVPGAALANDTYIVNTVVTDNSGNVSTASWSFAVEVNYDTTAPRIDVVSPQGIVRVDMPSVSASASDVSDTAQEGLSGVANVEISVAASDGSAVDGSSEFDGSGSAVFTPGGALANGEYTATATVTDNSGNASSTSWTFTVEVIMDIAEPIIGVASPSGIVRVDMPTITASATDEMSGVGNIEISVAASDGSAVDGSSEFDGATMGTFTPGAGLANDTYTATAVVTDNAGNETKGSWSFTVEVVMDTLPPIITTTSPHGLVRDDMPSINVSATDDMSGVARIAISVSNPNGVIAGNTEFDGEGLGTFTPDAALSNHTYTVVTVVTDNAGNDSSASWSFSLEADSAPPVVNTTSPQGTIRTNSPRINVSATDEISGIASFAIRVIRSDFERIFGDTVFEGGTKASFKPNNELRNDTYSVAVDVTDKAGNVTNVSWSFTVQVDTTPPVISANSPLGIVRDDMPRVTVSATDDESGMDNIQVWVRNSRFERVAGRTVYEGGTTAAFAPDRPLRNDTYAVGVTATDKAGNSSDARWTFVLEADRTPPVINVTSPQGIIRDDTPRIGVSATDDISGIASFDIRVRNSRFERIAGPTTFEGGTFGFFSPTSRMKNDTYTVAVTVTDKAGNATNANWVFTIEVDEVPPTIGDTGPHGIIRTSTPRITVSATDDLSGIRSIAFRVANSRTFERVSGRTDFQGGTFASWSPTGAMGNDVYTVAVDVTDKSGNVARSGWSFTVEVDTVPPTIGHTSPSGSVRPDSPIISVHATDDLSGIGSIAIVLRDSNQNLVPGRSVFEGGTSGTFVPSVPLDFGTHYVGVKVKDKAGNEATASYSFTVESADGLAVLNARNFPNPFAGATKIAFTLTRSSEISIEIFDLSGRPVWRMSPTTIQATREHVIGWDGTTSSGEKLSRGVYICQIMVHDSLNPQYAILKMAIK